MEPRVPWELMVSLVLTVLTEKTVTQVLLENLAR